MIYELFYYLFIYLNILIFFIFFLQVKHLPKQCTIHYRQALSSIKDWEKIQEDPPLYKKKLHASSDKKFVMNS